MKQTELLDSVLPTVPSPTYELLDRKLGIYTTAIYHMFVPAYLSQLTAKKIPENYLADKIPFIFNATYEFSQMYSGCLAKSIEGKLDYLKSFNIPDSFDPSKCEQNLADIYAGYSGVYFALDKMQDMLTYEDFKIALAKNPKEFIYKFLTNQIK